MEYILQAAYLSDRFNLVYYDLETTGLETTTDRIYELAAIRLNRDGSQFSFERLINPEQDLSEEWAQKVGIAPDEPRLKGVAAAAALREFISFSAGAVLVGHNILRFDNPLLTAELLRHGLPGLPQSATTPPHFIDTFRMAEKLLGRWFDNGDRDWGFGGPRTFSLENVAKHLKVEYDSAHLHHAMADCKMSMAVHQLLQPRVDKAMAKIRDQSETDSYPALGRPR